MTIKDFVTQAHKELSLIEEMNGECIYSSCETFKKGKFYFLGLNPGGAGFISIKASLDQFPTHTTNDFFDASWNSDSHDYEQGMHPLQQRVQFLFNDILNYDLHNVFSTNLIFKTTNNSNQLNFGLAGLCWKVHQLALDVVQPKIIITCGNGNGNSAFSFIHDIYAKVEYETISLTSTFSIKVCEISIQKRPTLLIGLPHLSLYEIRDNELFKQKLLEVLEIYRWINS